MKTGFTRERLSQPRVAAANDILRACVHCGFCAPACPTYHLTGDERDSPRGRIWLIRDLLESDGAPSDEAVFHLDRCLECVACMPACPSGVNYGALIGVAREEIHERARRPFWSRLWRAVLASVLTHAGRARRMMGLARLTGWLAPVLPAMLAAPLRLAARAPRPQGAIGPAPGTYPAQGTQRGRVALLAGCVQAAMAPGINAALIRLLNRHGIEAVVVNDAPCCGALDRHLGRGDAARDHARAVVAAIGAAAGAEGFDAVLQTSSGCGTMMKDYGNLLAGDAAAAGLAAKVRDSAEYLAGLDLKFGAALPALVAGWIAPCSAVNAQSVVEAPKALLTAAGITVAEPADGGRCCGSAGVYNLLEPALSGALGDEKARALAALGPNVVVAGNIGCMLQMAGRSPAPVLHMVEMLDWATGGPLPGVLAGSGFDRTLSA